MVLRKADDVVNKVGGAWLDLNQGCYNSPAKGGRGGYGVLREPGRGYRLITPGC